MIVSLAHDRLMSGAFHNHRPSQCDVIAFVRHIVKLNGDEWTVVSLRSCDAQSEVPEIASLNFK